MAQMKLVQCEGKCGGKVPVKDVKMVEVDEDLGAAMCPSCYEDWQEGSG